MALWQTTELAVLWQRSSGWFTSTIHSPIFSISLFGQHLHTTRQLQAIRKKPQKNNKKLEKTIEIFINTETLKKDSKKQKWRSN